MEKKKLVIVESPTKAKTINKYLGKDYAVEASVGHIKDLNKYTLSIDIQNGFKPIYQIIPGKQKTVKEIKDKAKNARAVLIATDPDREGEAIAFHIAEEIKQVNPNIKRLVFNEITKTGIENGIKNLRDLDEKLYFSQQARRVLDRLIGYKISPFVTKTLANSKSEALSAGRVQSVALRLICEREEDIANFEPFTYFNILGKFSIKNKNINAKLVKFDGKEIRNPDGSKKPQRDETENEYQKRIHKFLFIETEEQAKELIERIQKEEYSVSKVKKTEITISPKPPFITSTLQQEAARKLGFSNKKTMMLAQRLYEGVPIGAEGNVGLITYMRTDSVRVSNEAIEKARNHILNTFGKDYLPENARIFQSKGQNVQDAHEAIRPTYIDYTPEQLKDYLEKDLYKLYQLIYNRFIASQMASATVEQTTIDISSQNFVFRATGRVVTFDGFMKLYEESESSDDENERDPEEKNPRLPKVAEGEKAKLLEVDYKESKTSPPPRYNSASLIKELESKGIGRPSTYATIVSTLLERKYIAQKGKAFVPTELGIQVKKILIQYFSNIFNVDFTAKMEEELDKLAEGKAEYVKVIEKYYKPLSGLLSEATKNEIENTNEVCEKCGAPMVVRISKYGKFLGCSRYPKCNFTKKLEDQTPKNEPQIAEGVTCDLCGKPMVIRQSRHGKFLSCIDYPNCKGKKPFNSNGTKSSFTPVEILSEKCPKCGSTMILRRGPKGYFLGCKNYPNCKGTKKVTKKEAEQLISQSDTRSD